MKASKNAYLIVMSYLVASPAWAQVATVLPDRIGDSVERAVERGSEDVLELEEQSSDDTQENKLNPEEDAKSISSGDDSILSKLPSSANLKKLELKIQQEPNNLDHYFSYAQMASLLGEYEKAVEIYEVMLRMLPTLDRVRLDLGAVYMRMGRLEDAKREMQTVLDREPPDQVRKNIEGILAKIDNELREFAISAYVSAGINYDSNANSAPGTDSILIFDTEINLAPDQRKEDDLQGFVAAGLTHKYSPLWARGDEVLGRWVSSANYYETEQSSLESLDLQVLSIKMGPEVMFKNWGLKLMPALSHSHITLATQTYLRNTAAEMGIEYNVTPAFMISTGIKHEYRRFENSDTVSTYEDREGTATQGRLGARYVINTKNFVQLNASLRRERTEVDYYDNQQISVNASYTHLFRPDIIAAANVGWRSSVYEDNDSLISTKRRHDKETSGGINLTKRLNKTISATIGYQYRDVESNILNYDYDNHRFLGSISARF